MKMPLFRFLKHHQHIPVRQGITALLCSIINKIIITIPEYFLAITVTMIMQGDSEHKLLHLLLLIVCMLSLWVLGAVFHYTENMVWNHVAQNMAHSLRVQCYQKLEQDCLLASLDQEKVGNIVSIMNDDVNQIDIFFRASANDAIHLIVGSLIIGTLYLYHSPLIALIALLPLPFIALLSFRFQKKLQRAYLMSRDQAGKLAIHITQALQTNTYNRHLLEHESLSYKQITLDAARISSFFYPLINLIIAGGFMFTVGVSGYFTITGTFSAGTFSVILFQAQRLLWPFARIGTIVDTYERMIASMVRIQSFIEQGNTLPEAIHPYQKPSTEKENRI